MRHSEWKNLRGLAVPARWEMHSMTTRTKLRHEPQPGENEPHPGDEQGHDSTMHPAAALRQPCS